MVPKKSQKEVCGVYIRYCALNAMYRDCDMDLKFKRGWEDNEVCVMSNPVTIILCKWGEKSDVTAWEWN